MKGAAVTARIEELAAAAQAKTGLADFGGDSWREGLEVLVGSALSEASFNEMGEKSFYGSVVQARPIELRRMPEALVFECRHRGLEDLEAPEPRVWLDGVLAPTAEHRFGSLQ